MVRTTSRCDLEILLADGTTWLPLMLARPRGDDGQTAEGVEPSLQEVLAASDNDLPTSKRLQAVEKEDWSGGLGVDYHDADGVYTRTGGYGCPAGAATAISLPAPVSGTDNSQIVAIRQWGNDLFAAQTGNGSANTGRVMRSTDGGTTWTNSLSLGANKYARDLISFDNGAGTEYLYLSVSNQPDPNPGTDGWFYRWDGASWSAISAAAGYSRQRMAKVFWVTQDGVGDWRLVTISGSKTISYTRPGVDPFTNSATQWVEGVRIRTGWNLLRLVGWNRHVYATAQDGTFDLDEQGNSPRLTDYTTTLLHGSNGLASLALNDYIYNSLGQGIDRVYVGDGASLQQTIGQCAPGRGTRARTKWTHSWTTELYAEQGMVVNAVHNPTTLESGIFWGEDRQISGTDTKNPLVWWGPEIVITGGYKVTAMQSFSPSNDDLRLLVAGWKSGSAPAMAWVSLPISGAPMDDLVSGGKHRFATGTGVTFGTGLIQPRCELRMLDEAFGSRASSKALYKHTVNSEGLGGSTTMTLKERADPAPTSTSWTTSTTINTSPTQDVSATTVVSGNRIELLVAFTGTTTAPPVLDSLRTTAWRNVPSVGVRVIDVEYGDGVTDMYGVGERDFAPDDITALLLALIDAGGRTTLRDRQDRRWTVRVEQVLDREEKLGDGPWGKSVKARLEVDVIAAVN